MCACPHAREHVCECVYTRTSNRLQALPSKALPSPTKKAGAPTAGVLATVSLCACAGRQAGRGRLGRVSVRLSLCGGSGAGVEGCGMPQNMCGPATLMPRWAGKAVPSPVPTTSLLRTCPAAPCPWPLGPHVIWNPTLALPPFFPVALGKPFLSRCRLCHLCYEWTVFMVFPLPIFCESGISLGCLSQREAEEGSILMGQFSI